MSTTTTPADLIETQYRRSYWREYVRESGFKPYMGAGSEGTMSVIHTAMEPTKGGKSLIIPLVGRLAGSGVEGNTRLTGAEESLGKHSHSVTVQFSRNAVELSKQDEAYDFSTAREAVRPLLKEWSTSRLRDRIIDAMHMSSFSGAVGKTWGTPLDAGRNIISDATANNTWSAANVDRVQYGKLVSNYSATFATGLATIDNTDDKLTAALVTLAKRLAKTADPHIRPIRTEDGREYYVMFTGSLPFRDLKNDSTIISNMRDARSREGNGMNSNPLFQDGDLMHDGVIIREIPEFPVFANTNAVNCGLSALCGAQAVALAYGQEPRFTKKNEDDYGFFEGIGIEELVGCNKVMRKHGIAGTFKDHGMVSVFTAAVADS
jgi:hypothetical protein